MIQNSLDDLLISCSNCHFYRGLDKLAPKMSEAAIDSGSPGNNPRQATKEEIIELYKLAYS